MSMSAFEAYREYVALKQHFTRAEYDYFKFKGKLKSVSPASFDKRNDKLFFQKLAKHDDPQGLIVSNLLRDKRLWIRDIAYSEVAEKTYRDWLKKQQSLMYVFKQELSALDSNFDSNFRVVGNHPGLMRLYLGKKISLETLVILVDLVGCMSYWARQLQYDPVAEEVLDTMKKYRPFLRYDRERAKSVVLDAFGVV
jgi:T4 gene Gp59 loader of gp41 DNA helicase